MLAYQTFGDNTLVDHSLIRNRDRSIKYIPPVFAVLV